MSTKVPIYLKLGRRKGKSSCGPAVLGHYQPGGADAGFCTRMSKGTEAPELTSEGSQHMAKRTY